MNSYPTPANPIAAAIHPDPYQYYATLVEERPFYRDETLGAWIASSAAAVTTVFKHELCKVRPAREPVPSALLGSPAAEIFRRLIRMNDGQGHCPLNRAVAATLQSAAPKARELSTQWAKNLLGRLAVAKNRNDISRFAFQLSSHVMGDLLGIPDERLGEASECVGEFVRCVFGTPDPELLERGKVAAGNLWSLAQSAIDTHDGLLTTLMREAERVGRPDRDVVIANGIGFLSQAYEATAGLIGNSLLALARHETIRAQVLSQRDLTRELILEVLRHDSPAQSTRRFLSADGDVCGHELRAGDMIVVLLAAANRDSQANPEPDRFQLRRADRRLFTFGVGTHACPGDVFALAIAEAGVAALIDAGIDLERLQENFTYRASANTRIPLFAD
jgi:cytochrome P450